MCKYREKDMYEYVQRYRYGRGRGKAIGGGRYRLLAEVQPIAASMPVDGLYLWLMSDHVTRVSQNISVRVSDNLSTFPALLFSNSESSALLIFAMIPSASSLRT
jgi:hypothetical protein